MRFTSFCNILSNIGFLHDLKIPELWIHGKFSSASKEHIWQYLQNLMVYVSPEADKRLGDIVTDRPKPFNIDKGKLSTDMNKILEGIPDGMFTKVQHIADEYGEKMKNGELDLKNLKIEEISQKLMGDLDADEISRMMEMFAPLIENMKL